MGEALPLGPMSLLCFSAKTARQQHEGDTRRLQGIGSWLSTVDLGKEDVEDEKGTALICEV